MKTLIENGADLNGTPFPLNNFNIDRDNYMNTIDLLVDEYLYNSDSVSKTEIIETTIKLLVENGAYVMNSWIELNNNTQNDKSKKLSQIINKATSAYAQKIAFNTNKKYYSKFLTEKKIMPEISENILSFTG